LKNNKDFHEKIKKHEKETNYYLFINELEEIPIKLNSESCLYYFFLYMKKISYNKNKNRSCHEWKPPSSRVNS